MAFPTETVYGLGAAALNADAIQSIFDAKGRPSDNPLIVHVADQEMVSWIATDVSDTARSLMDAFWPGPLTLVLPKSEVVPLITTGGLDTVAVRVPAHDIALALIREAAIPIAAPSANRSGLPSPTTAGHVLQDLDGRIEMILDGGPCKVGVESTVVDARGATPVILRPGAVTASAIHDVIGAVERPRIDDLRRSPGTQHPHYAPSAQVEVMEGAESPAHIETRYLALVAQGARPHVVLSRESADTWAHRSDDVTVVAGRTEHDAWATRLYGVLRAADSRGDSHLLVEGIEARGMGVAVMDRLRRAAGR